MPRRAGLSVLAVLGLLVGLVSAACVDVPEPLSLQEYGEWCAEVTLAIGLDAPTRLQTEDYELTWGEADAVWSAAAERFEGIAPPPEAAAYHEAMDEVLQTLLTVSETNEADEQFSVYSLYAVALGVGQAALEAQQAMPDEVEQVLRETGCLEPTPDEGHEGEAFPIGSVELDRSEPRSVGERITVERIWQDDRFELVVHGPVEEADPYHRVMVTIYSLSEEWTYAAGWDDDAIQLVSEPDANGRIYILDETDQIWERPEDALWDVFLITGGRHEGALYFGGYAPPGTKFQELRYPDGDVRRVVRFAD